MIYEPKEDDGPLHVVPVHDSREHECSKDCWCNPYLDEACVTSDEYIEGEIWIHNAADGREIFENGTRKVS